MVNVGVARRNEALAKQMGEKIHFEPIVKASFYLPKDCQREFYQRLEDYQVLAIAHYIGLAFNGFFDKSAIVNGIMNKLDPNKHKPLAEQD